MFAFLDFVTDFEFSPFDDYLLATGSADNSVSLVFFHKLNFWGGGGFFFCKKGGRGGGGGGEGGGERGYCLLFF